MECLTEMACPLCEKRAFDTNDLPMMEITITLKCPHCGTFVSIPMTREHVLKKRNGSRKKRK